MTIEHVKAFGTWLSNMLYWVLLPVLGPLTAIEPSPDHSSADLDEGPLDGQKAAMEWFNTFDPGVYGSLGESMAHGGSGMEIGSGRYL